MKGAALKLPRYIKPSTASTRATSAREVMTPTWTQDYQLVLGSSSRWRAAVLKKHGYTFTQMSPDVDEKAIRDEDPQLLTQAIAKAKLEVLKHQVDSSKPTILVCSDQVVTYAGTIREKPESVEEAKLFINSYINSGCSTVTAVCVYNNRTQKQACAVDIATVRFGLIPENVIQQVLAKGDVMHCAGGFTVEDPLVAPYVQGIDGTTESIEGLPVHVMEWLINRTL